MLLTRLAPNSYVPIAIFTGWLFCVGTSTLPMKMLCFITKHAVSARHSVLTASQSARSSLNGHASTAADGCTPVAELEVLVQGLCEVKPQALKKLRLQRHCVQPAVS